MLSLYIKHTYTQSLFLSDTHTHTHTHKRTHSFTFIFILTSSLYITHTHIQTNKQTKKNSFARHLTIKSGCSLNMNRKAKVKFFRQALIFFPSYLKFHFEMNDFFFAFLQFTKNNYFLNIIFNVCKFP